MWLFRVSGPGGVAAFELNDAVPGAAQGCRRHGVAEAALTERDDAAVRGFGQLVLVEQYFSGGELRGIGDRAGGVFGAVADVEEAQVRS